MTTSMGMPMMKSVIKEMKEIEISDSKLDVTTEGSDDVAPMGDDMTGELFTLLFLRKVAQSFRNNSNYLLLIIAKIIKINLYPIINISVQKFTGD